MRINWFFLIQTIAFFNSQQPAHYMPKYIDSQTTKEVFNWKQHLIFAVYNGIVILAVLVGYQQNKLNRCRSINCTGLFFGWGR